MVNLSIDLPDGFLEPEPKTLVVTSERKRVWAVALDLLSQLDRVCKKHGIRYFCDGGTLLGAVRHGGFVPWDDDLDVIMPRVEYNRLCAVAPSEFTHPYFWQTNETDPGSARGHAQLRNSDTTGILKSEMIGDKPVYSFNQGLFIDVFPFDNLPDDPAERKAFIAEITRAKGAILDIKRDRSRIQDLRKQISLRTLYHGCKPVLREWRARCKKEDRLSLACRALDELAQRYNNVPAKYMAPVSFKPEHREVLPSCFFDEVEYLDFEFMKIPVIKNYREVLKINYGNWEKHIIGAAAHGGMFIDVERPYTEYLKG